MKALVIATLVLWQAAAAGIATEARHLRYQRPVIGTANGTACAVLDAPAFAHAASRTGDDLRLFSADGQEVPFALTENEPQPDAAAQATVQNLGTHDGATVFDLAMPQRPYSEIDLTLNAKNFIATAEVTDAASGTKLGTFTLFDLEAQKLSRSTALMLQESTFPRLHVVMHFRSPEGTAWQGPEGSAGPLVAGASVPPSRNAQGIYTTVARTEAVEQRGHDTAVTFTVPAHVPVERIRVELDPGFHANFVRVVSVVEGSDPAESIGEISRTHIKLPAMPTAPPIDKETLAVDAVLGGNLRADGRVTVLIHNGDDRPLPIRAVLLEMRQRRICFASAAGSSYTLRYGDDALRAPVYDYARLFDSAAATESAALGPEATNPQYVPRADVRSYTERHSELLWIVLLGVVAVLGATAISSAKHQGRG